MNGTTTWRRPGLIVCLLLGIILTSGLIGCSHASGDGSVSGSTQMDSVEDAASADASGTDSDTAGTAGTTQTADEPADDPYADADFDSAAQSAVAAVQTGMSGDVALTQATDAAITVDTATRSLYMTLAVNGDDVTQGCDSGKALINLYLKDFEQSNADLVASSDYGLLDVYTVYISVDDPGRDLDLDGTFVNGSDSVMWQ